MGLCINVATKYIVKISPVFINTPYITGETYTDKILKVVKFLKNFNSYWQDREGDIPRIIEVNKDEIYDYIVCHPHSEYKEVLEDMLDVSDKDNNYIHIEIS